MLLVPRAEPVPVEVNADGVALVGERELPWIQL